MFSNTCVIALLLVGVLVLVLVPVLLHWLFSYSLYYSWQIYMLMAQSLSFPLLYSLYARNMIDTHHTWPDQIRHVASKGFLTPRMSLPLSICAVNHARLRLTFKKEQQLKRLVKNLPAATVLNLPDLAQGAKESSKFRKAWLVREQWLEYSRQDC